MKHLAVRRLPLWVGIVVGVFCGLGSGPLSAQLFERALVLKNARIVPMDGRIIPSGTIVIRGGRVTALGADAKAPMLSRSVDLQGKTVTPGFIDLHSALGVAVGSASGGAHARTRDAFDRYATDDLRAALRNGVTAAYLSGSRAAGIRGTGCVVRLVPGAGETFGEFVDGGDALEIDLGSDQRPLARISTFNAIRKKLQQAKDYGTALEDYEEELAEYEKELKDRAEKEEKEEKNGKKGDRRGAAQPAPDPPKKPDEKKKEEELKKPKEPSRQPDLPVLLDVLERKLPVRIEAHRSEDIINALSLIEEFSLDAILVGATDAHLVVDEIASAEVGVLLGTQLRPDVFRDDAYWRHLARTGSVLSAVGIPWWIGSGATSGAETRFVAQNAQLAAAHNDVPDALALVTRDAARLLGMERRLGRLGRNRPADLVVWTGDPADPASRVERVYVGGMLAYEASAPSGPGSGEGEGKR